MAAVSKRNGSDTFIDYLYLGLVIDKEKGNCKSKNRGIFSYDVSTGTFEAATENYIFAPVGGSRRKKRVSVDFGDLFLVNSFLYPSGLMDAVDSIK